MKNTTKYTSSRPANYTNAPIEDRVQNLFCGSESYFTDAEAREVLSAIVSEVAHITAVRNCPNQGFTRLAIYGFKLASEPFITWANGEPL
jgi:hypothetical protein